MFLVEKVNCWGAWDKAPATCFEQPHPPFDLHKERENLMLERESPRTLFHCTPGSTCTMRFDFSFIIFSGFLHRARHIQSAT